MRTFPLLISAAVIAVSLFAQAPVATKTTAPKAAPKAAAPKAATKATTASKLTPPPAGEFVINMPNGHGKPDGPAKLLSSYRGQVVVLAFMYTTCPHCQNMARELAKVQTEYQGKGVQVLGVVFDDNAKDGADGFVKITGANFPVGYSSKALVEKYLHIDDYYVPMLVFIDRAGTIRTQIVQVDETPDSIAGKFLSNKEKAIRTEVDKLLKLPAASAK